ncbi:MAG: hypothetical protein IPH74_15605 [Bacteroidetes bacterium]|nr:hypothetical protein [Bacteroidota bacterium]
MGDGNTYDPGLEDTVLSCVCCLVPNSGVEQRLTGENIEILTNDIFARKFAIFLIKI